MSWWKLKGVSRWFRKEVRDKISFGDVLDIIPLLTPNELREVYRMITPLLDPPPMAWGHEREIRHEGDE